MKDWKCKCGCGGEVRAFRHKYIHGHSAVGNKHDEDSKQKMRRPKLYCLIKKSEKEVIK